MLPESVVYAGELCTEAGFDGLDPRWFRLAQAAGFRQAQPTVVRAGFDGLNPRGFRQAQPAVPGGHAGSVMSATVAS